MPIFNGPDFRNHTPRRAMGSETEFTIQLRSYPDISAIDALTPHISYLASPREVWLRNGGRLYYDLASDPLFEYATPECLSGEEVLLHEKAGELLTATAAHEITNGQDFAAFKRTGYTDIFSPDGKQLMATKSVGHHENYSTPLIQSREETDMPALLSYLATRPLWAGAGIITKEGFELCQKSGAVNYREDSPNSLTAHGSKMPTRIQVDRLEVRTGDGNMSPWAIRTKFAMTSLVLRLIEHGKFPNELIFDDSDFLHHVATVTSINPLMSFDKSLPDINAVSHQSAIAHAALDFAHNHHIPLEERQAANDILAITQILDSETPLSVSSEAIADRVDWAAKWMKLRRLLGMSAADLGDITTNNLRAVRYDLLWEAVDANAPSARYYRSVGNTINPIAASAALGQPPRSRAQVRVAYQEMMTYPAKTMDWHLVTHHDDTIFRMPSAYSSRLKKARKQLGLLQQSN